jgi:hypothetical protein
VKKPLWTTLAVALWMLVAGTVNAAEKAAEGAKPVVTISFSGYNALLQNVKHVGELAGRPELAQAVEGMVAMVTAGKGLSGLDKDRPWGAVLYSTQDGFSAQGFVPVSDLKQLLSAIPNPATGEPFAPDSKGVYEMKNSDGKTIYFAQKGTWAVVADSHEGLENLPADPVAQLGGLEKTYLVAVRAIVHNVPEAVREQFFAQWKAFSELSAQGSDDDDNLSSVLAGANKQNMLRLANLVKELDEVVVGLGLDPSTQAAMLDVEVKALPGTATAEQLAKAKDAKTDFAGFLVSGSAVSAVSTQTIEDRDVAQFKKTLAKARTVAEKDLDANEDLSPNRKKLAKQLLGEFLDVVEKTLDAKKLDYGLTLTLNAGTPTLVAGMALADGTKLDQMIQQLVTEAGKDKADVLKQIKLNAETLGDVHFHVASVPINDEDAATYLGKTLDVVVGIGEKSAYIGAGKDALTLLKQVIGDSKSQAGKAVPPGQIVVTLTPIVKYIAQVAPSDEAKAFAGLLGQSLAKAAGRDHITATTNVVPNGQRLHLVVEEGVLKAILGAIPGGPGATPKEGKTTGGN